MTLVESQQVVGDLVKTFSATADREKVARLKATVRETAELHAKTLGVVRAKREGLERRVAEKRRAAERATVVASVGGDASATEKEHLRRLRALEEERRDGAAQVDEAEREAQSLENVFLQLETELAELEEAEAAERAAAKKDPTVLRLKIMRSLGIDLLNKSSAVVPPDGPAPTAPLKVRVQSRTKNDIHTVSIDYAKCSKFFYVNQLWELCT